MDFVQTMKDWQRMCNTIKSCADCPMQKEDGWTYVLCSEGGISSTRPEVVEKVIIKWAAEHPEPVYPTWEEWLQSVGVMESSEGLIRRIQGQLLIDGIPAYAVPTSKVLRPMDADIAQKLWIEPKEG